LTEEQLAILNSFPEKDRGVFDPNDEQAMCDGMMKPLDDPLEAAAMRAKLK
jgi:hypothetical protein